MSHEEAREAGDRGALEGRLGYRFRNRNLLDEALTHASFVHQSGAEGRTDYDRLEFLGDAVLGFLLAEDEFHAAPHARSGELSQRRAERVRRASLAVAGARLGLGEWVFLSAGERLQGGMRRRRLLADLYEAVVGAIYLDGGIDSARAFVRATVGSGQAAQAPGADDYKSRLQEALQAEGLAAPVYRIAETGGPPHAPVFLVQVEIDGRPSGQGVGGSRREAEQAAARVALDAMLPHD